MRIVSVCVISLLATQATGQVVVTHVGDTVVDSSRRYARVLRPDGTTHPDARGTWKVPGYGYVAVIDDAKIRMFNTTRNHVWSYGYDEELTDLLFYRLPDGQHALFVSEPSVPPFVAVQTDDWPTESTDRKSWTAPQIFEAFEESMSELYAFFEERNFDWAASVRKPKPSVTSDSTDMELFNAMSQALNGLEDAHIGLSTELNGKVQAVRLGVPETFQKAAAAFDSQTEFDDFDAFLNTRLMRIQQDMASRVLQGDIHHTCNNLVWGKAPGNVGYLFIAGMAGFSDDDHVSEELKTLHKGINEVLTELSDCKSLVIDITTNGGGADEFSIAIASHFSDQRRLGFSKGPGNHPEIRHEVFIEPATTLDPLAVMWTKPVYLATSDITVSAAEIFVLCMKDLPHVTTVGLPTRGALSDILVKQLPNGWNFGFSNEVYRDSKGVCFEATRIPPDIAMEIFSVEQADTGHADAILKIVEKAAGE